MFYLKRALPVLLFNLFLFSSNGYTEESYQTEIIGVYEKEDADTTTDKIIGLVAEIYFSPVSTDNKPLAQAAFLDKKSSVSVGYMNFKTDLQNASVDSIDLGGPIIGINYITETDAFILGAAYSKLDGDTNPDFLTIDSEIVSFTIGKYINDSTIVQASYTSGDAEYRNTASSQTSYLDLDYYELSYITVQSLGATNYYSFGIGFELISKEGSTSVKEDNNEFKVLGNYYFSRMTSLGVAAAFNSGDDVSDEGQTLAIGVTHFFTPQLALGISLAKFNADDINTEDTDSISLTVRARI